MQYLYDANLIGADSGVLDLGRVDLHAADLSGANLSGANLRSAYLRSAHLNGNENTIWPGRFHPAKEGMENVRS